MNQSANRSFRSTETAVLKIQNYISVDSGKALALTLLDLSAAFDMTAHSILHYCVLKTGFDGDVLTWIDSYLNN